MVPQTPKAAGNAKGLEFSVILSPLVGEELHGDRYPAGATERELL